MGECYFTFDRLPNYQMSTRTLMHVSNRLLPGGGHLPWLNDPETDGPLTEAGHWDRARTTLETMGDPSP